MNRKLIAGGLATESIGFSRGRQSFGLVQRFADDLSGYRRRDARAVRVDRRGRQARQCSASAYPSPER